MKRNRFNLERSVGWQLDEDGDGLLDRELWALWWSKRCEANPSPEKQLEVHTLQQFVIIQLHTVVSTVAYVAGMLLERWVDLSTTCTQRRPALFEGDGVHTTKPAYANLY